MRFRQLLHSILFLFFLVNSVTAQKIVSLTYGDSLSGFDEGGALRIGVEEGYSGQTLRLFLEVEKRRYIMSKYDMFPKPIYAPPQLTPYQSTFSNSKFGNPNTVFAAPCVNEGFELGNISGWTASVGQNSASGSSTTSCVYPNATTTIAFPTNSLITASVTPFTDAYYGFTVPASPFTGSVVMRLNDNVLGNLSNGQGFEMVRLRSGQFNVTTTNFLYQFAFIMVATSAHTCCQQPFMRVNLINNIGTPISCPLFTMAPPPSSGPSCSSSGITWALAGSIYRNPSWQQYAIDLTSYIGSNVAVEVHVSNCALGGHWAYAYFDSNCGELGFTLNNSTFYSAPTSTVNIQATCGGNATLTAPTGLGPYSWLGPSGFSSSSQTIVTSSAGSYSIQMNPPGICSPITRVINLSFPPPTTVTASPATVCTAGSLSSTLIATGATNYTWLPSGPFTATNVVAPTVTTIYSVTVRTGTCIGTRTVQVTVSPSPTVVVTNSSPLICAGGNSTLSATGAATYTWNPGNLTGSLQVVTPSTTTTYSVVGTTTAGCTDTESTAVTVTTAPTVFNLPWSPASGSVCSGNAIMMAGIGASSFTWFSTTEPSQTGFFPVFHPTVTTTYTAVGGSGSCTNSAVYTVTADPGPSMTVAANPTITCPGINTTLTAVAPTAVGSLTWNPGGSTGTAVVVAPLSTTVYSVTGVNGNNCPRTTTLNKLVAPVPSPTISPTSPSVCIGSAISLTASGGISYTWAPIVSNNTIISVSPTVNTSYTVTASNGTCTNTTSVTVVVVPTPTVLAGATPTAICQGAVATLTASGATTYTWNPGNLSGASVTVSPASNTVYTVTGNSGGCTSTKTVALTVNPLPVVTVTATPNPVCRGNCATLTTGGAQTYTVLGGFTSVVCPTSTSIFSVSGTSSLGCISAQPGTVSIVVNATPNIIFNPATPTLCSGTSITVSAIGGTSYTWQPGSLVGSTQTLAPATTTVYTVTALNAFNCSSSKTIQLTVTSSPTVVPVASPTLLCSGSSSTLTATGASNYTWLPGGATNSNVVVTPTANTTYTVNGSTNGCTSTSFVTVSVNITPTVNASVSPTAICRGGSATLTASGAATFTWLPGSMTTAVAVVNPTNNTTYTLTGTTNGCSNTKTVTLVVNPLPTVAITATPNPLCRGNCATLTPTGAQTYTVLGGFTSVVCPTSTATFSISGTSSLGCISAQPGTITVAVNATPNISFVPAAPVVCPGSSVNVTAIGGTSYTWMPGSLLGGSQNLSPTVTTAYSVTAANAFGCRTTRTVQVTVLPSPTINITSNPTVVCSAGCATLSPTGASTYTYLNGGPVVCPTITTTYSVTGTGTNGCVSQQPGTLSLIVSPPPSITLTPSSASICAGGSTSITATGALSFTWNPGNLSGSGQLLSPGSTTTYTVSGTSAQGCIGQNSITITVVPNPTVTASASPTAICRGATAVLSATGATTYSWNPVNLTGNPVSVNPTVTTTYTITGSTAGCTGTRTLTLVVNPLPTISIASNPTVVCAGSCATLTPTGASTYTYLNGGPVVCPTIATVYSVTGTSSLGCVAASPGTIQINVNPLPTISVSPSSATICAGTSVNLNAGGAVSFTWNPGNLIGSSQNVSPGSTTTYTVSGTSALGCIGLTTAIVNVVPNPTVTASASPTAICRGATAALSATGAATYSWNPGNLTGNPVSVSPTVTTTYTVIGSTSGCTGTRTVTLVVNPLPTVNVTSNPTVVCAGLCATLTPTGASTYTYLNGGPVVCPTIATVYSVTGTSSLGCIAAAPGTVTLNVSPLPTLTFSPASPSICAGTSVNVTATGANTYTWNPGNLVGASQNLGPAATTIYTVNATSTAGCLGQRTVAVQVVPNPTVLASANPTAICNGASAVLTASGATSYTWNPGNVTGNPITVNPTITTTYTVQGSTSGCAGTRTLTLIVNPLPTVNVTSNPTVVCAGLCATLTPTGASTYTYLNGGPVVCPTIATVYSVTGTSSLGCIAAAPGMVTVNVSPLPTLTFSPASPSICAGTSVNVTASGANTYTWNPGNLVGASQNLGPAATTIYTVNATSTAGCLGQRTVAVQVVPNPTVLASVSPTAICRGSSAVLTASGATTYSWNPGNVTGNPITVNPTITTTYTVTGNAAGCSGTRTVTLIVNPLPTVGVASNPTAVCAGSCATLTPSGASTYTYLNGGPVVCPTIATTYSVAGTSSLGCLAASPGTITINVNPIPSLSFSPSSPSICAGTSVNITASGANTYTWNPGNLAGASQNLGPAATTAYTVGGTSAQGCVGQATITVTVVPNPTVGASASPTVICFGGSAVLTGTGATSYNWNPGSIPGSPVTVTPAATTIYTVTGTTAGCNGTRTVLVTVNPLPTISVASNPTMICAGACVTLSPTGANSYTYLNGGPVICPTISTTYSVSGTSSLGCVSATPGTVNVIVNPVPSMTLSSTSPSMCSSGNVTITASGAANYTWFPGGFGGTVVAVTPTATTTFTVLGKLTPTSCVGQQTITIIVIPTPSITAATSAASICLGGNATLTANGAPNYTWLPINQNGSVVVVSPTIQTTYTVTGSSGGCTSLPAFVTVSVTAPASGTAIATPTDVCLNGCTTLSLTGSNGSVQWQFSTSSSVGPFSPVLGGTTNPFTACTITSTRWYRAQVTNICGSAISNVVQVVLNPTPSLTLTALSSTICAGSNTVLTATGANTYTWNPGNLIGATQTLSPASTTVYTISGTSTAGCIGTTNATVNVISPPVFTVAATPTAICVGGTSTLTATAGLQYTWMPGSLSGNNVTVNPVSTTIYTVSGTSGAGICPGTRTVLVTVNPLPTISVAASPTAVCIGLCTTLTPSGAQTYTYLNGGPVVCPSSGTTYSVTGTSSVGCVSAAAGLVSVNVIPLPTLTLSPQISTICLGTSTVVTVTGASTYTWNPGLLIGGTQTLTPGSTTIYTISGTSTAGCIGTGNATVNVLPAPAFTITANPATICVGATTTLNAIAGPILQYTWMPGSLTGNGVTVTPASTTTYTAYGSNGTGICPGIRTVVVTVNPLPTISVAASPTAVCIGLCTTLTPSGAQTYTYLNGGPVVCPTVGTTYSVTGTSSAGCVSAGPGGTFIVVNPLPTLTISPQTSTICGGSSTVVTATGANTYTWNPGILIGGTQTLAPASTTVYSISGTSTAGCIGNANATVNVVAPPPFTVTATPATICVGAVSTLTATAGLQYTWMPGSLSGNVVTVTPASTTIYTAIATSTTPFNQCPGTRTLLVTVNPLPTITAAASPTAGCPGFCSTITPLGAQSYTYLNGGPVVCPTTSATYSVVGTSSLGCVSAQPGVVSIVLNPNPSLSVTPSPGTICAGQIATVQAGGATSYTWSPGGFTTSAISVTPATTTIYTVSGSNGLCTLSMTTAVVVNANPTLVANGAPLSICQGGSATLTATGAAGFTWSPGSFTNSPVLVNPTVTTSYVITGTNAAGCSDTKTVTITVGAQPILTITASSNTICAGASATLTAFGTLSYSWLPGGMTTSVVVVNPGSSTNYTVIGANGPSCGNTTVFPLVVSPIPQVSVSPVNSSICAGFSTTLTASGASNFSWNPGATTGSQAVVNPTSTTIYTVTGSTAGCGNTATAVVNVVPIPTIIATASPATICLGAVSSLSANGATNYTWMPGSIPGTIVTVTPSSTTVYTVSGNASGCNGTSTLMVSVNPLPTITAASNPTAVCPGFCSTITPQGAQTYTYLNGGPVVCPPITTTYSIVGTSSLGCVSAQPGTVGVVVNPIPSLSVTPSPGTICAGQTSTLQAGGATAYTWSPGGFTTSAISVTPASTSVYTLTGSLGSCATSMTATIIVNANPTLVANGAPLSICNGGSATLTATGAAGFTWTPGSFTTSPVLVTPTVTTSYVVTGTNGAGCSDTKTVTITVGSQPVLTITASSNTICAGASATLTAFGTLSYTWLPGGMTTSVVVVNPGSSTNYTVFGVNGPACANTTIFPLVVSPVPQVSVSPVNSTLCAGLSATLSASGASTYSWSPGTATGSQVVVSPTSTTVYTVSGDVAGCANTATANVTILPLPVISAAASPTSICIGSSAVLTGTGASTYTWFPPGTPGNNITVSPTTTTTYTVDGTGANGCPNSQTMVLSVLPLPTLAISASGTAVCIGNSGTLTVTGASNYTWLPGSQTGSVAVISPTSPTTYTVIGDNGACTGTASVTIGINPLPTVTAVSSASLVCGGVPVTFTATGASTYTWAPPNISGSVVVDSPTITTVYTVTGEDANGCSNTANVSVSVNPAPIMNASANPTAICLGGSVALTGTGVVTSLTWTPTGGNVPSFTDTPTTTTTYTLSGTDAIGCVGSATVQVVVAPIPTVNISPLGATVCAGSPATFTATGATNFTWNPGGTTGSVVVEAPTITTTYTVTGDNGGNCPTTATVEVFVNPIPANVTATTSGTITCTTPSVTLSGSSSNTNVTYSWTGPQGYTSSAQNPTGVTVWGTFTVTASFSTGCSSSATVDVPTDNSIPSVTASTSGSITCSASQVTLIAANTTFSPGFAWTGPAGYTSSVSPTTASVAGVYTVTVTDLISTCSTTAVVTVGTHTSVFITATIVPATCTAGVTNNDGTILVGNYSSLDRFDLVAGTTYSGGATYSTAINIPSNGILTSNLANPTTTVPFTVRFFDSEGCTKDTTMFLKPVDCAIHSLGIAKLVSSVATNTTDGSYDVVYSIIVRNYDTTSLNRVVIFDNLVAAFGSPATVTVQSVTTSGGAFSVNAGYNGSSQAAITSTASSLSAASTATITLHLRVLANGFFGPFNNSATGTAVNNISVTVSDVSTNGPNPDPDHDGNPANNSQSTPLTLTPDLFFGLTKEGGYILADNFTSYDVTYTVTVFNRGNDTLKNILVRDSLAGMTIRQPATFTMRSAPSTTGGLIANSNYNGSSDNNLLAAGSRLSPGEVQKIIFSINVVPDTVTVISNIAVGKATSSHSGTVVRDTSNSGSNPDTNGNHEWNEFVDNRPTVVVLPALAGARTSTPLFIPGGFSPDGDGVNDAFVIKGLPDGVNSSLTIYNRWGNRIYYHSNYHDAEPWDGTPNIAGTVGKSKVSRGTYYYILDIHEEGRKPITGFIVIQY